MNLGDTFTVQEWDAAREWAVSHNCEIEETEETGVFKIVSRSEPTKEELAKRIRQVRNLRLLESDYRMTVDSYNKMTPGEQSDWTAYRQYLRDIPESPDFPESVIVMTFNDWLVSAGRTSAGE